MEMVRGYIGGSAKLQILKDNTCKLTVTDRKEIKEKCYLCYIISYIRIRR